MRKVSKTSGSSLLFLSEKSPLGMSFMLRQQMIDALKSGQTIRILDFDSSYENMINTVESVNATGQNSFSNKEEFILWYHLAQFRTKGKKSIYECLRAEYNLKRFKEYKKLTLGYLKTAHKRTKEQCKKQSVTNRIILDNVGCKIFLKNT